LIKIIRIDGIVDEKGAEIEKELQRSQSRKRILEISSR